MHVCVDLVKDFILINREAGSDGRWANREEVAGKVQMGAFFGLYGV